LGFQTIIAIGFHHICWWSSYHFGIIALVLRQV